MSYPQLQRYYWKIANKKHKIRENSLKIYLPSYLTTLLEKHFQFKVCVKTYPAFYATFSLLVIDDHKPDFRQTKLYFDWSYSVIWILHTELKLAQICSCLQENFDI